MKKAQRPSRGGWSQPSPRAEIVVEVRSLDRATRAQRFTIQHGTSGHVDDEVIVTLMLDAWTSGQEQESNTYASELLRRVTKHVRSHVRKNPGWQRFGGGAKAAIDDFCQVTVLSILQGEPVPCHAEVAFGDFVYKRCLDEAGKFYAKKRIAGKPFDDGVDGVEIHEHADDFGGSPAETASPEQSLIEMEELLSEQGNLERIRRIVPDLPELPKIAFTFRYYAELKIESKKTDVITVTSLMDVTEKTATKYINQAIAIIKERLSND
jgi:hypothetical protein